MIVWMSLRSGVPGQDSVYTLKNYATLLGDPYTYRVMKTTLLFAAITIAVSVPLGFIFAWFIERTNMPCKTVAMSVLSIGILFPTFLKAMGWVFLLHPRIGVINIFFMQLFGLTQAPLNIATVPGIGFVQGMTLVPLAYVMISAALRSMNPALVEAANVHGVSQWRTLIRIELPLIWPALFSAVIWMLTVAIAAFDVPGVIGMANNIFTFSTAIYYMINPNEGLPRYGLCGAYGSIMVVRVADFDDSVFSRAQTKPPLSNHFRQILSVAPGGSRPLALGRVGDAGQLFSACFRIAAAGDFLGIVAALRPSAIMADSQSDILRALHASRVRQRAARRRMEYVGTDDRRANCDRNHLHGDLVDRHALAHARPRGARCHSFLPHPVPHILFALAIAYLALLVSNVIPLYGTIYVLMAVYVVCWISFGTRVLNNSMIQVHRELEEAAQVGGASTFRIIAKIIAPLIKPGLVYAWIWTSLSAYRELTMAVFLSSPKSQVLSTYIWGQWHGGGLGDAAAIAIMMIAVMSPVVTSFWIFARKQQQVAGSAT